MKQYECITYRIKQKYTKLTAIYKTIKKGSKRTSLHFTTLHPTTLHNTYRHFTPSHFTFSYVSASYSGVKGDVLWMVFQHKGSACGRAPSHDTVWWSELPAQRILDPCTKWWRANNFTPRPLTLGVGGTRYSLDVRVRSTL